jgi:Cu-Zn family superoxide dismutase
MEVYRVPPNRTFGAHAHALKCDDTQGGGHYENIPGNIDPVNSEIWLDFTTDARGHGRVKVLSPFAVKAGGVQSFVIHTNPTDPATGKAGAKLACADLTIE